MNEFELPTAAPVFGKKAMVVSGHSLATLAGVETLKRGGSAADALVATSAVLAVVVGHATSIGGDCFTLYHEAGAKGPIGMNASGVAPMLAEPGVFAGGMERHGPKAPVVPGLVKGWHSLHSRYGRLPWESLFDDAIRYAEAAPVSQVMITQMPGYRYAVERDPGCAATYLPGGSPLNIGDTLRQPALADTLRTIAREGAASFYEGSIASRISAFFEGNGGLIRKDDLAAYDVDWVQPIATNYRGHQVNVMPPNSYGVLLLMQLNGLSGIDSQALAGDPYRRIAYQMSAMQEAFRLGVPSIADKRFCEGEADRLLGQEVTQAMQQAVRNGVEASSFDNGGGTACVLIVDDEGNAVNQVQSVFNVFGGAVLDQDTGILFNNRMFGFKSEPGARNSVAPGKRPAHTLCPVMVYREDGRLRYLTTSPGGLSQSLLNAQLLTHLIDRGGDVAQAVHSPRWCADGAGALMIEPTMPEATVGELRRYGFDVTRIADGYYYGSAKAIEILADGNLAGAGDNRREAFALGY